MYDEEAILNLYRHGQSLQETINILNDEMLFSATKEKVAKLFSRHGIKLEEKDMKGIEFYRGKVM